MSSVLACFFFTLTDIFKSHNTTLSGDVCNDMIPINGINWTADCGGDTPKVKIAPVVPFVERTVDKAIRLSPKCNQIAYQIEVGATDGHIHCEWSSDNHTISCHYIEQCPTCDENGTACGTQL